MDECNVSLVKNKLTFRQAGEYLRRPIFDIDIKNCVKTLQHTDSSSDSDDASQISNILIDKNDKPEKILTLKDYKKKLKTVGDDFKYIDSFTDCFKSIILDMDRDKTFLIDNVVDEIVNGKNVIKDIPNKQTELQDVENNLSKFLNENITVPDFSEYDLIEDDDEYDGEISIYWKLLEQKDNKEAYNANKNEYNFEKTHWLDRPPVSWEVIDGAVKKCELWLKKHFMSK